MLAQSSDFVYMLYLVLKYIFGESKVLKNYTVVYSNSTIRVSHICIVIVSILSWFVEQNIEVA